MSNGFKGWEHLYEELAQLISDNIPEVKWIDLWHNQVGFLQEEHNFTTPAVFIAFRMLSAEDLGELSQDANIQIDLYWFYETFLDTNQGAYNQEDALSYLKTVSDLHRLLHGKTGVNFSELRRIAFAAVDTGSAGNLYRISFSGKIIDATAAKTFTEVSPGDLETGEGAAPAEDNNSRFIIG